MFLSVMVSDWHFLQSHRLTCDPSLQPSPAIVAHKYLHLPLQPQIRKQLKAAIHMDFHKTAPTFGPLVMARLFSSLSALALTYRSEELPRYL